MNTEEQQKIVRDACTKLCEHFDSVRIFATCPTEDGEQNTRAIDEGCGNYYATLGQVIEWLAVQDQYQRNWANRDEERTRRDRPNEDEP